MCHAHARPCLSTGWALNRRFGLTFGTAAVLAQGGGGSDNEPRLIIGNAMGTAMHVGLVAYVFIVLDLNLDLKRRPFLRNSETAAQACLIAALQQL